MALTFTRASSKYLRIAGASITAAPVTMACWFYPTDFTNFQVLMSINNIGSSFNNFRFDFSANMAGDPVTATAWDSGGVSGGASSSGASGTSAWYHGAAVYASSTSRTAYFNGGNTGTDTASRVPSGLNDTEIGSYRFGSSAPEAFFDGYMAEVAMWSAALDAAEIAALAKGFSPMLIRPTSLVYYIPGLVDIVDRRGTVWTNNNSVGFTTHPRVIMPKRRRSGEFTTAAAATTTPKLIGGNLIRPNLVRGRLAA